MIVLEFAPKIERNGEVLGGCLPRFTDVPDSVWHGVLDTHAPRSEGGDETELVALARDNAERAREILDAAPADPQAVFVNDPTIPLQHERSDPGRLTAIAIGGTVPF